MGRYQDFTDILLAMLKIKVYLCENKKEEALEEVNMLMSMLEGMKRKARIGSI